jgi:hypothetical protein
MQVTGCPRRPCADGRACLSHDSQPGACRHRRCSAPVHGVDDLGVIDPPQIHGHDPKICVPQLTLDDRRRHPTHRLVLDDAATQPALHRRHPRQGTHRPRRIPPRARPSRPHPRSRTTPHRPHPQAQPPLNGRHLHVNDSNHQYCRVIDTNGGTYCLLSRIPDNCNRRGGRKRPRVVLAHSRCDRTARGRSSDGGNAAPSGRGNYGDNVDGPALKADSTSVGFADGEMQLNSRHRVGVCRAAGHPWL